MQILCVNIAHLRAQCKRKVVPSLLQGSIHTKDKDKHFFTLSPFYVNLQLDPLSEKRNFSLMFAVNEM